MEFIAPTGMVLTQDNQGNDNSIDSDAEREGLTAVGRTSTVTLTAAQPQADFDAGFTPPAAIVYVVYDDKDADKVQDVDEPGVPGATVTLYDSEGNLVAEATSDANGHVRFDDLTPGQYSVIVIPPTAIVHRWIGYRHCRH